MRRLLPLLLLLTLLAAQPAHADSNLFAWTLRLENTGSAKPMDMALADAGGVFVVGYTDDAAGYFGKAYGGNDGFILRVDASGDVLWKKRFGGSGDEVFSRVIQTADGGCLAMGTTTSQDGDARAGRGGLDAFLVRLTATGETVWIKCLGGTLDDELLDVLEAENGDLIACGRTKSRNEDLRSNYGGWDAWITRLSSVDGKPLWLDRYGDGGDDSFSKLAAFGDGWLVLGEYSEELAAGDNGDPVFQQRPLAMLYDGDGTRIWQSPVVLGGTDQNRLITIHDTDTGWLLLGETNSRSAIMPTRGGLDIWMLHLRQGGTVQWQRTYGGSQDDKPYLVRNVPSGGFVILGTTSSGDGQVTGLHGEDDLWVLRVSATGVLEWQQTLGGSNRSFPAGLLVTSDGRFLVAGSSLSQDGDIGQHVSVRTGFLAALQSNGNLLWTALVGGDEECTLLDLKAKDGAAYLLGNIRTITSNGLCENTLLYRLSPDIYPDGETKVE